MSLTSNPQTRLRHLTMLSSPERWPTWPFLPVVRRIPGSSEPECGLVYDARHTSGTYGLAATVFLVNLFFVPRTEAEFLALPHCSYDTFEELLDAGWSVD